jgi:hypothetical protein
MYDKYKGHTEGPWIVEPINDDVRISPSDCRRNGGIIIAICYGNAKKANANLIADAPKLLEQNKRMYSKLCHIKHYFDTFHEESIKEANTPEREQYWFICKLIKEIEGS